MGKETRERFSFLINIAYFAVMFLLVYIVLKHIIPIIFPFLIAFFLVSLVNPLVRRMKERFPKQRSLIGVILMAIIYILIGVLLFTGLLTLFFWLKDDAIPMLQTTYYEDSIKPAMTDLWTNLSVFLKQLPPRWVELLETVQANLSQQIQNLLVNVGSSLIGWIGSFTGKLPGFVIAFVFTIMLSFFVSMQYEEVVGFIKLQLPEKALAFVSDLRSILGKTAFQYLRAVFTLMMITAVELSIGLSLLKIDHAIVVGIVIAIFDALPVFGTGAVMIPWAVIELLRGNIELAIGLGILYGVVTLVRNFIEPKIVGDKLGLNPIVSIIAIFIGFKVFGVFGMIFMPIVAQLIVELNRRGTIKLFKMPSQTTPTPPVTPKSGTSKQSSSGDSDQ